MARLPTVYFYPRVRRAVPLSTPLEPSWHFPNPAALSPGLLQHTRRVTLGQDRKLLLSRSNVPIGQLNPLSSSYPTKPLSKFLTPSVNWEATNFVSRDSRLCRCLKGQPEQNIWSTLWETGSAHWSSKSYLQQLRKKNHN